MAPRETHPINPGNWASVNQWTARDEMRRTARGIIGENMPPEAAANTSILIDGTVYYMLVGLSAGDIVTGVGFYASTGGTAMSTSLGGLYSLNPATLAATLLSGSADQGTAWNTSGIKQVPLSTPQQIPASGGYLVAILGKTGTTMVTAHRGPAATTNNGQIGTGYPTYGTLTGQTTLAASPTVSLSGSPIGIAAFVY